MYTLPQNKTFMDCIQVSTQKKTITSFYGIINIFFKISRVYSFRRVRKKQTFFDFLTLEKLRELTLPFHFPSCNYYLSAFLRKEDLKKSFFLLNLIYWYSWVGQKCQRFFATKTTAASVGTTLSTSKTLTFCVSFALDVNTGLKSSCGLTYVTSPKGTNCC